MAGFLRLLLLGSAVAGLHAVETEGRANPIRKVVTMLQNMQTKVTEEGKKEQELYDKFMCYCKTGTGDLDASIEAAQTKIEELTASIEEAKKKHEQLAGNLKADKEALAEAKEAMSKATAIREKEAADYAKEKSELETNLAALAKAITAIENGAAGSFLQTNAANAVRNWVMEKAEMPDTTRQELLSFLSGSDSEGYAPQSGEITGILKTMEDEMSKSLEEATTAEKEAIANYDALMAAKKKESSALQKQIEEAMARGGNLGVEIAEMENDLEDTKEALTQDEKFKVQLATECATKTKEWEEIKATRAEELVALADTIKILNDDDALDLFKKTLPSASSFMQLAVSSKAVRARALQIVRTASHKRSNAKLDLIALALSGKKIGFEKVIGMIDEMVANLKKEQEDDDMKKEYCEMEFDKSDDKRKSLEQSIKDSETAIKEMKGAIETLGKEIEALKDGIKKLDKSVAEATEQRKEENADYKELMTNDSTAKEVLAFAKNRLNKFYNPKLYKPPPKQELTEEERITVNMGGTLAPTAAPGGIAGTGIGAAASFVQIRLHAQAKDEGAPPPPPETFGPYTKKSEESGGVIAMIDLLVKDLDKEMQEAEVMEKDAQSDYEKMMEEAATKRATDTKSITEKESTKASTEEELQDEKDKKKATTKELLGTVEYIASLHQECDWLLQNFDARKEARTSESEALANAKAVLSGADYSLIQTASHARVGFMAKRK